jgi:hypothetical protein
VDLERQGLGGTLRLRVQEIRSRPDAGPGLALR